MARLRLDVHADLIQVLLKSLDRILFVVEIIVVEAIKMHSERVSIKILVSVIVEPTPNPVLGNVVIYDVETSTIK